jgi:hypothetical protein
MTNAPRSALLPSSLVHVYIILCVYTHVYTHVYTYMVYCIVYYIKFLCVCVCVCVCVCLCVSVCVCIAQVADPRSPLRNSPSTRRVTKADVHVGHVSPPPNAAVLPPRQSEGHSPAAQPPPIQPPAPPPGGDSAAEKRAKAAALTRTQNVVPMSVTGGGVHVPSPSVTNVSPPPASPVPGRRGGGTQIKIALKDDVTQNSEVVTLPGSLPELLQVYALWRTN